MGESLKKRNANMDLLRIISMMMVTTLHALDKSGLLQSFTGDVSANGVVAWIMESLSIGAVNIFMLISGYFLIDSEFRIKRLLEIVFQTFFYAFIPYAIFYVAGLIPAEEKDFYHFLNSFLPVHMNTYWFITAYIVLYMLSPIISSGVKALTKKRFVTVLLCLLIYECFFKSILPIRLTTDTQGYGFLWYLIVFLIGAGFKLFGTGHADSAAKGWILYFCGAATVLFSTVTIGMFIKHTGRLGGLEKLFLEYNHVFVLMTALGIFTAFIHMKPMNEKAGRVVCAISPMALGVYLLQESPVIRFEWQKWFGLPDIMGLPAPLFVLRVLAAVLGMYVIGTAVDYIRRLLFKAFEKIFEKKQPVGE